MTILGWAAAQNSFGDSTGVCHLIVTRPSSKFPGEEVGGAACNPKVRVFGQVHAKPPEYSPRMCKRCMFSEQRLLLIEAKRQRDADRELVRKCQATMLRPWKCGLMPMAGSGSPQVIYASCDTEEEAKRYMEARSRLNGGVFPHRLTQEVGWWCELGGTSPPDLRRDEEDEEEEEADRKRALINEWDDTRENYEPEEED